MIHTSRQLKALIRNISESDSDKAQLLIRNYGMERFLERVSLSRYKDNFILKGGILVASLVGLDNRATMDIDTTIRNLPLDVDNAPKIVEDIIAVPVDDNIHFELKDASRVMDEAEYGGIRLSLEAHLDTMRIPLKIDISTGDAITPAAIDYCYKLMFEDRSIELWAYNIETVLAEKIETVLARSTANTRLRDYYDVYILQEAGFPIDIVVLTAALHATCHKRESEQLLPRYEMILDQIENSKAMSQLWRNYQEKNSYAADINWDTVVTSIRTLCGFCFPSEKV